MRSRLACTPTRCVPIISICPSELSSAASIPLQIMEIISNIDSACLMFQSSGIPSRYRHRSCCISILGCRGFLWDHIERNIPIKKPNLAQTDDIFRKFATTILRWEVDGSKDDADKLWARDGAKTKNAMRKIMEAAVDREMTRRYTQHWS